MDLEMAKEETPRTIGHHLQSRRARNHVSCTRGENVIEPIVLTNMMAKQLLLKNGSAKAKAAAPKGKAKAAAAKAKSAAVVVQVKREDNNGYLSDWSDNDDPSPVAAGRATRKKPNNLVKKDKMVKIKWKPERIQIDVGIDTRGLPKGNRVRNSEPRYVKKEFLRSETFRHQAMVDHLIARARARVLSNDINGRKPEVKVMLGKDIYVEVKWKGNEIVESVVKKSKTRILKKQAPCASADASGRSVRSSDSSWILDVVMILYPSERSGNWIWKPSLITKE